MSPASRLMLLVMISALAVTSASAQGPATGTPPFGSFGGGPDVINLANLNAHWTIPLLHKPGRGTNFDYDLTYDSSVWTLSASTWQPTSTTTVPGWQRLAPAGQSYILYSMTYTSGQCYNGGPVNYYEWSFSGFVYYDPYGGTHYINYSPVYFQSPGGSNCPPNGPQPSTPQPTQPNDGSGYTLYATPGPGSASAYLVDKNGSTISPPVVTSPPSSGGWTVADRNGNQITFSNGTYTDTLGTQALAVIGTAPSNTNISYTAPSGAAATYVASYKTYTVRTNFGCNGITEYNASGTIQTSLVDKVTLPDGSYYQFNYETTYQDSHSPHHVTGRIASVILPTGGTISYQYSSGGTGVNGISCSDGSATTLIRTTPDGTWTYARTIGTSGASATLITDPSSQANQSIVQFEGIYETQRDVYQGSAPTFSSLPISESTLQTSSLLRETQTCYNASSSPCTTTSVTLPITQRNVTDQYGASGLQCQHNYFYNSTGGLLEQDDYDYGSGGPGALLRKTLITFFSSIPAFPKTVAICNGTGSSTSCTGASGSSTGTVVSQTTYNYDETGVAAPANQPTPQHTSVSGSRGNLTSINYPVSGLTSHFTYYDTGNMNVATEVNGGQTTYTYGSLSATCGNAFPTGITAAISTLAQSYSWNCTGGVMTQLADENSKNTSITYNDAYFWRPNASTDQLSNVTTFTYYPPPPNTKAEAYMFFNSGNSIVDQITTFDPLGRVSTTQIRQSPNVNNFNTVETDYNAAGRLSRVTLPYVVTQWGQTNPSAPATTTSYDALNRPLTVTDGGGGTLTYTYTNNDVLVTVGPAPSGEGTKRRQMEYDALGRLTSVCEITAGTTAWPSGNCAQNLSQTGYWTKYSYDALGDLLTVTQNAQATSANQQTRTYAFDAMSRLTSETNPESGTKNYVYDSDSTMCGNGTYTSKGDLLKTTDAAGNCVMRYYDALHRLTDVGDVSRCLRFRYDNTNGVLGSKPSGVSVNNTLARLAEAETDTCASPITQSSIITDEWFSYTARGEQSDVYESTPHSGGYYHISAQYWANGTLSQLGNNIAGLPAFTYGVDGEGRINTVSANSGQNPVTGVTYNNSSLPTQVTFGSADTDIFAYDSNTMRMTQYQFNVNGQSDTGALTWNANSTLQKLVVTDAFNSADNQTCNYGYDDIIRLASANCGAAAAQTFTYDPFGNINKSGSPYSFQPTYSSATNRMTSLPGNFTPTYDANGNVTNDSNHTYSWDADGNSITIDSVGLTFDALDRSVEKNVSGSYTQIVYSPTGNKLALMNGQTLQKAFVPLPGQATAVYTGGGLDHYRHSDWLGSARLTSTPTRAVASTTAYAPFGETYAQSGSPDTSFTGENTDTVSGDDDFLFREYSTEGRWPSPDPAGLAAVNLANPQSWNRYAYVLNNPLGFVDPLGLYCVYYSDEGVTIEAIDGNSSPGECEATGGVWVDPPVETVTVTADPMGSDPYDPSNAGNNSIYDDRANALANAINKTGVQSLGNPCTVVVFYGASAVGGAGAGALLGGEAAGVGGAVVASSTPYWAIATSWLYRQALTAFPVINSLRYAYGKTTAAVQSGCNAMQ